MVLLKYILELRLCQYRKLKILKIQEHYQVTKCQLKNFMFKARFIANLL